MTKSSILLQKKITSETQEYVERLQKENEDLQAALKAARAQLKETRGLTISDSELKKISDYFGDNTCDCSFVEIAAFRNPFVRYVMNDGTTIICDAYLHYSDANEYCFSSCADSSGVYYVFTFKNDNTFSTVRNEIMPRFTPVPYINENMDDGKIPNVGAIIAESNRILGINAEQKY